MSETREDVELIDGRHFLLACTINDFLDHQCSSLAMDSSKDRATLTCKLINMLEQEGIIG